MITKVINVNLHQPIYERLTAKQGDNASRFISFHLLDGDTPFDLTGKSVRVYAIKPDKTEIFNDLIINDETKGYCTLELTSQCLASAGVVKMELYISESGKMLTSIPFELEVIARINTKGIVSTDEFSALEEALSTLQDYCNLRREIIEARNEYGTVGERLDNFDSQLDKKAEQSEVNKRLRFRNFKPKFGYNCIWGEIWGTDGTHTQKNRIEIGNDIKHCEKLGIDEITVTIHIGYNSNTSALYIATNMADVLWAIEECSNLHVKIKNAKIHVGISEDYLKNTITLPVFLRLYKTIVSDICVQLKNTSIENVTVLNECAFIDTDSTYTTDVLELLNIGKNNGFKVGITCAGVEHNYRLPGVILGLSDLLCVNCYPTISFKKDKTTYEDSINAWKQHEINLWIKTRKEQYPDKKIIISETGVTNCWEALLSPASNVANSKVSNKATEIYLKGLFEVLNKDDLDSVWWWFGIFTEGTNIQKMFDYELRGLINE